MRATIAASQTKGAHQLCAGTCPQHSSTINSESPLKLVQRVDCGDETARPVAMNRDEKRGVATVPRDQQEDQPGFLPLDPSSGRVSRRALCDPDYRRQTEPGRREKAVSGDLQDISFDEWHARNPGLRGLEIARRRRRGKTTLMNGACFTSRARGCGRRVRFSVERGATRQGPAREAPAAASGDFPARWSAPVSTCLPPERGLGFAEIFRGAVANGASAGRH